MNGAHPRRSDTHAEHRARINSQRERTLSLKTANDVLASHPEVRASDAMALARKYLSAFDAMAANKKSDSRAMMVALRSSIEAIVRAIG